MKNVPLLRGKAIFNLFFEPSTRTRTTFEIAAKRLSADVVNLNIATSSQTKGETLLDTVANLSAMHADMFIVRHSQSGAAHLIARHVGPDIHVVNAGDGRHAHPTQALLDMFTIRHFKGGFSQLRVAIVGDIAALACGALRDPRAHHAGRAGGASDRSAHAASQQQSSSSGCRCFTTWSAAWKGWMW